MAELMPLGRSSSLASELRVPDRKREEERTGAGEQAPSADRVDLSVQAERLLQKGAPEPRPAAGAPSAGDGGVRLTTEDGDVVTLSPESREAVEKAFREGSGAEPVRTDLSSTTLASGATVSVYTLTAEGRGDADILAEITLADGSRQTLSITGNTIIGEDENGALLVRTGDEGLLEGTAGNEVFIVLEDRTVVRGEGGNDTVVAFQGVAEATLGDGDNTLVSHNNAVIGNVHAGNGNNSFLGDRFGNITFGNGNNVVDVRTSGDIRGGDGDNRITLKEYQSAVASYTGEEYLLLYGASEHVQEIHLGNGNNVISSAWSSLIELGNGNNDVTARLVNNIRTGDGNNSVKLGQVILDSELRFGNGNNTIDVENTAFAVDLITGDGDNSITFYQKHLNGIDIVTGNGRNDIHVLSDLSFCDIKTGNGDTSLLIEGNALGLIYNGGAGRDSIRVKGFLERADIHTGGGADEVTVDSFVLNSSIFTGFAGEGDALNLNGLLIDVYLNDEEYKWNTGAEEDRAAARAEAAQWYQSMLDAVDVKYREWLAQREQPAPSAS